MEGKFLPKRLNIDAFGKGGFRFGGYSHSGSLLVLPSGMHAWRPTSVTDLRAEDFAQLLNEKEAIDFLLIGAGAHLARLPSKLVAVLNGFNWDTMTTSAAVSTYNVMRAEGRRVSACLLAVDDAHAR